MTVAELIAELQKQPPGKAVRVVMSEVYFADEQGEGHVHIHESEAQPADEVRNEGPYVLIRAR